MTGVNELIKALEEGSIRALSRTVSILEEGGELAQAIFQKLFDKTKGIRIIGITGPPGAGKSTITDALALELRKQGKRVAILAVDPSSPFTGGALLGDRIRMVNSAETEEIFIRSMASRGAAGGLAPRTKEVIYAIDAAGFDVVLLETVGVGQGEIEVVRTADSVVVVLVPGMGDGVQALKAGILEIADLFAINKADYDGVERLEKELRTLIGLTESTGWDPTVSRTIATTGEGIIPLVSELDRHWQYLQRSGELSKRRSRFLEEYLRESAMERIANEVLISEVFNAKLRQAIEEIMNKTLDPTTGVDKLVETALPKKRPKN